MLSQLRAQDTALRIIERALEGDRVHHAYLFTGPDGVGKELAAFGFAQALVCERRGATAPPHLFGSATSGQTARACGACSACTRAVPRVDPAASSASARSVPVHPDVVVVERGLYAPQAIGRRTPETQDISIDQIRTLVLARSAYAPHEGRAKVFVIRKADELSISAANALLKTLEEPGPKTHFVLLTSHPDALLPTILSRTLRVRFAPLPDEIVAELLVMRGVGETRAHEVARLSGGSVELGVTLADPDESAARERFVESALEAVAKASVEAVLALAEEGKKGKDRLRANVVALATAFAERAAEAARTGRPEAQVFAERGRIALTALEHLDGNAAPQLVVEGMLTRMRGL